MVGINKNNQIYYVHSDIINTPRVITNIGGNPVWSMDYSDVFDNEVNANSSIEFNHRYMGQYYDSESELNYNYYRYYSPMLGRYTQPDPIGLDGGWNTYAYVENSTFDSVDTNGLDVWIEGSSYDEPIPHLSIAIGNPYGEYYSFSFGISDNKFGAVYEDNFKFGKIYNLLKSDKITDNLIIKDLISQVDKDNKKTYLIDQTCIGYSKDKFNYIKNKYNLKNGEFKQREKIYREPSIFGFINYLIIGENND